MSTLGVCSINRRATEEYVKEAEVNKCFRLYQKSVVSYSRIIDILAAAQAAMRGIPGLWAIRQRLAEAEVDLSRLGDGISVVPELAEEILAERRLKGQAGAAAVRVPADDWDEELPEEE
jgi:hypothetical protein